MRYASGGSDYDEELKLLPTIGGPQWSQTSVMFVAAKDVVAVDVTLLLGQGNAAQTLDYDDM